MSPEKPSIIGIVLCGIATSLFVMLAYLIPQEYIQLGVIGLAIVFFSAGGVLLVEYMAYRWLEIRGEYKHQEAISPTYLAIKAASQLTPEQAAAVNHRGGPAEIAMIDTREGVTFSLSTPTGLVPVEWIDDFIKHSGFTELTPVRFYSDGTPGRAYAVAFTDWLVSRKFATPANGPNPARWLTDQSRAQVIELLGLEIET